MYWLVYDPSILRSFDPSIGNSGVLHALRSFDPFSYLQSLETLIQTLELELAKHILKEGQPLPHAAASLTFCFSTFDCSMIDVTSASSVSSASSNTGAGSEAICCRRRQRQWRRQWQRQRQQQQRRRQQQRAQSTSKQLRHSNYHMSRWNLTKCAR